MRQDDYPAAQFLPVPSPGSFFQVKFLFDDGLYVYECGGESEESSIPSLKTSESVVINKFYAKTGA